VIKEEDRQGMWKAWGKERSV